MLVILAKVVVTLVIVMGIFVSVNYHGRKNTSGGNDGPSVMLASIGMAALYWLGGAFDTVTNITPVFIIWLVLCAVWSQVQCRMPRINGYASLFSICVTAVFLKLLGFWNLSN